MDTHIHPVCIHEYAHANCSFCHDTHLDAGPYWGNSGINPDTANPGPGRPGLQTDLHLPRAPEPAQPGLHDERLDADADVDGRRERATSDRAAVKEKP